MRQLAGIAVALLSLPLLFWLQHEVAAEWHEANAYKEQVEETIELSDPVVTIPMAFYDRDGTLFAEEYTEWRDPLPISEIPLFAKQLFLESEDKGFYEHRGYDVAAIARAFAVNANADGLSQGASTITQQVVRMRFLSPEKTYERKFREILYSAELEKQATKDEILEMYMNEMYFGNHVYGIGAAATYYFSKPLSQLNEAETAFLAAVPNNPSLYDPLRHFDSAKKRQERLLRVLTDSRIISEPERAAISAMPVTLHVKRKNSRFPAYQTYVVNELQQLIYEKEGFADRLRKAETDEQRAAVRKQAAARYTQVVNSGIRIDTALNAAKQQTVEKGISDRLGGSGIQAGGAIIDNSTRELAALYGGFGYRKSDFNRGYQAVRQPGSAIKPLLVYAPYLESGPYTEDSPIDGSGICIGSYCPRNFGGYQYGVTTLKKAFSHSYNTTAVRMLQRVGVDEAFARLSPFQFSHFTDADHQYSAALGGFENGATPFEMADAFTSFIDGTYKPARAIRSVKDRAGNVLYEWDDAQQTVWSPKTAAAIRSMLQETVKTGTARGVRQTTSFTGAKTGTTTAYKDLWVAGMNDEYTAAVWTGYDRPRTLRKESEQKLHLRLFSAALSD